MATTDQPSTSDSPAKETPTEYSKTRNDVMYKVKEMKFAERSKHIVLQNENGPCPLIAISNTLLLKNDMTLYPYASEVSQTRLLNLVRETLILANVDFYSDEQPKDVSDAVQRIPCLADGMNVNIKFKSIDDFEPTPELDIFRLLNIRLYHGWIVDPQDFETANAIGCKSYNDITTELVALETQTLKARSSQISGECSLDLSMPMPSALGECSKTGSFAEQRGWGKGDSEENLVLLRTLELSEREAYGFDVYQYPSSEEESEDENQTCEDEILGTSVDAAAGGICQENKADDQFMDCDVGIEEEAHSTVSSGALDRDQLCSTELGDETAVYVTTEIISEDKSNLESTENDSISEVPLKSEDVTFANPVPDSSVRSQNDDDDDRGDKSITFGSPFYEGEELLGKSSSKESDANGLTPKESEVIRSFDSPIYEGEELLGKKSSEESDTNGLTPEEGEVIRSFLNSNASQLTFHGLISLKKGVQECEPCVFFRNNHFSTMMKYKNELYILVSDQGYLAETDLVWERLDKVNGDCVYVTGEFKVFKSYSSESKNWNPIDAVTNAADYLHKMNSCLNESSDIDPDLKLAMELQQEEFSKDIGSGSEVRDDHNPYSLF